jgi:dTMP kinase
LLHFAARREHLVATVFPALEAGKWVVCDRFIDSTIAYQGYGHGVDRAFLDGLAVAVAGDFRPDLTLVLDLPVSAGLERAKSRGGAEDRYERMGVDFHERLRAGFLEIAGKEPERCAVIDAAQPLDKVTEAIIAAVGERLPESGLAGNT